MPPVVPTPAAERVCPLWSTTATFSGFMPLTAAEVRCTMASTCFGDSVELPEVSTKTEAVGSTVSETKTLSSGIASCTDAAVTPLIEEIVAASSPSMARLKVTDCWNSLVVTPILSSSEYPPELVPGSPADAAASRWS